MDALEMGKRIAQLRKARSLTQQQLADQLNVTNRAISRWERGEGYPEITLLPKLADCLGVTTDEILGHALPKRPARRLTQQPQLMIWIGLTVVLAVEIARRLQPQQNNLLALAGITLLVILGMLIVGMRLPMNKVSGVVYSGLWFFFVSQLAAQRTFLVLFSRLGPSPYLLFPNQHYFALQDALQYPAVLQLQSLLTQAIWLPGWLTSLTAFLFLNWKCHWYAHASGWVKLVKSLIWLGLISLTASVIVFQQSLQWNLEELPPQSYARLSQLYPAVISVLIVTALIGLAYFWLPRRKGLAAGLPMILLLVFYGSLLPVQKLDYYFFKAEKLIQDISTIKEGWDRIQLFVQWSRPFWLVGVVCLGTAAVLIDRREKQTKPGITPDDPQAFSPVGKSG